MAYGYDQVGHHLLHNALYMLCFRWILYLLILAIPGLSQSGPTLTPTQSRVVIGKVWGFLNYYHTEVARGRRDWDQQLVQLLEAAPQLDSRETLSASLLTLVQNLGPVKPCISCDKTDTSASVFRQNLDLTWLADTTLFTAPLREQLHLVAMNPNQRSNRYVHWNPLRNRLEFNVPAYSAMAFPNETYRLVGLIRYWNIIEYFYPGKYLIGRDWSQVLTELVPTFQQATDTLTYQLALRELIATIQDSHAELYVPKKYQLLSTPSYLFPPFQHTIVGDTLLVTGFYNDSLSRLNGIERGDRIVRIDGKPLSQLIGERSRYATGSNRSVDIQLISASLLAGTQAGVTLELLRQGQRVQKEVQRYPFQTFGYRYKSAETTRPKEIPATIGYVDMGRLRAGGVKRLMKQFRDRKGIIFDVRTYSKGTYQRLARYLNPAPAGFARFTKPDLSRPGLFNISPIRYVGRTNTSYYRGKVAILCNTHTQSAAESTCAALRTAPRARIIGSQSAGANGVVSYVTFPGNYRTRFTGIGVYTVDGIAVQGQGVPIDTEARPSCDDILSRTDRALLTAIEWIGQD